MHACRSTLEDPTLAAEVTDLSPDQVLELLDTELATARDANEPAAPPRRESLPAGPALRQDLGEGHLRWFVIAPPRIVRIETLVPTTALPAWREVPERVATSLRVGPAEEPRRR